jgi:hypothetical protein
MLQRALLTQPQVVAPQDARLNLSGERENIVGLDANHGGVCCFNPTLEDDQNVMKMVMANLTDLHKKALEGRGELVALPAPPNDILQAEHLAAASSDQTLENRFKQLSK